MSALLELIASDEPVGCLEMVPVANSDKALTV